VVTALASVEMGNALIFKPKDFTRLAASRILELSFTVQGRDLYLIAKGSLSKVDWQLIEDIVTISPEKLMLQH